MSPKLIADIAVGDEVRSYDFESRDDCYIEGVVLAIGETPLGHDGYSVRVTKQVAVGEERSDLIGKVVYPPLNGMEGLFGLTRFVRKLAELKRIPHGYMSSQYSWKLGEKYEIVGTMGPLVVVRIREGKFTHETSIHPDHFKD